MSGSLAINSDYKHSLLEGLELFRGVHADDVQHLLQRCDRRDIDQGELVLSPDAANDSVFLVLSGCLSVHVGSPDTSPMAMLEIGACAGEMSIIENRDPSAFVLGAEPSHLLVIQRDVLWEMIDASHEFAKNLLVVLSERVRNNNQVIADSYGELRKIEHHAKTDALTGLSNRRSMDESFARELRRCRKDQQPTSLIMIDVDNFKSFNDRFGHMAGDRALSAVATILKAQFRPRDLLARFGGDEFAILLPGIAQSGAMAIADRVRETVCGDTGDGSDSLIQIPIRLSMGVAEAAPDDDLQALIRRADAALYRAKHAGRNAVSS